MNRFFKKGYLQELIKYLTSKEYLTLLAFTICMGLTHGWIYKMIMDLIKL